MLQQPPHRYVHSSATRIPPVKSIVETLTIATALASASTFIYLCLNLFTQALAVEIDKQIHPSGHSDSLLTNSTSATDLGEPLNRDCSVNLSSLNLQQTDSTNALPPPPPVNGQTAEVLSVPDPSTPNNLCHGEQGGTAEPGPIFPHGMEASPGTPLPHNHNHNCNRADRVMFFCAPF